MSDCLFCKIAAGEIPSKAILRDGEFLAIHDANPQAPVHVLVMPVAHYATIGDFTEAGDDALLGSLLRIASRLGRELGPEGFRLVVNTGPNGGQTVDHLHVHLLAGRGMAWPPG
jgi:histidine triad (HIT) family protein